MYDFIILTAAITRPKLHMQIFPRNLQFTDTAKVKWLINIDKINNDYSIDETIENFRVIFSNAKNIDVEFLPAREKGCFFSATKHLAIRANQLLAVCKTGVLWLEDDWEINPKTGLTQFLSDIRLKRTKNMFRRHVVLCSGSLKQKQLVLETKKFSDDAFWFVSLVPRTKVSFNPGLWSKAMFAEGVYKILADVSVEQVDDPETLCADPLNEISVYKNVSLFVDPIFQDAGRRWSADIGLEKWEKDPTSLLEQGGVTYDQQLTRSTLSVEEGAKRSGFFLLPDLLLKSRVKLLVRTMYDKGNIKVKLLGIPWLSFELRMTESGETEVYMDRIHAWAYTCPFKKTTTEIVWHLDETTHNLSSIEVKSPVGNFTSNYHEKLPLYSVLLIPLQTIIGLLIYIISLAKITNKLESR